MLLEANLTTNLTAIRDPGGVALLHLADSLAALNAAPRAGTFRRAADVGTGAGFPLLPLAIVLPECRFTGIESVGKKCAFIQAAVERMNLPNVEVYCGRAENIGRKPETREQFDLVTARAVGAVSSLCEVSLPLLKVGGTMLLYKTEQALEEWNSAVPVIAALGGQPDGIYTYKFPRDEYRRVIFRAKKVKPTAAAFPRAAGVPFLKPLQASGR
jgi:16S rRNA (guanine527-N7)-methyltransferase